ncbi:YjcZ family sporulation protein [Paenibacillus sp. TY11]
MGGTDGAGYGGMFTSVGVILVLFILLVIVSRTWGL